MEALMPKESFVDLGNRTWLYSGAETPTHAGGMEAINEYLRNRSRGPEGRSRNADVEQACREKLARLMSGQASQIALVSSASEAISMVARSLGLRRGDNVVINTLEFPSGVLPWLAEKPNGVEVRVVPHSNWEVSVEDILARVDENTRLVMTSHVSYISGTRIDYRELYRRLKKTRALLMLDATQSLGAVPVDLNETDFVVCSTYKWLLSIHGMGIFGINPRRTQSIIPRSVGWRSITNLFTSDRFERYTLHEDARKFELSYPSYPAVYSLNFTTGLLLELCVERIEQHILDLGGYLIDKLRGLGYEVMTPSSPERRAGNVAFVNSSGEELAEDLRKIGIYVWGGDGRIRASVHVFNDSSDVDRLITALRKMDATIETR